MNQTSEREKRMFSSRVRIREIEFRVMNFICTLSKKGGRRESVVVSGMNAEK